VQNESDEVIYNLYTSNIKIIMGCGSQTGCLGPKPREREVYLDLVDTIHQEAIKMEIP
jgi:hypothetical protein